jgi:DNA-binding transcriptional LysR family regulator
MADRRLHVFYSVARLLSFTKAAEALHMTQPAVTFQVRQLEEHFNTRLFDRTHNKISLTAAGERVYAYAEKIFELYDELENSVRELTGEISGVLILGASTTIAEYMLPRLLGDFKAQYPHVQARLTVANSETIESRVSDHTLDVGLIESSSHHPQLASHVCCEDDLVAICSPKHAVAGYKFITPAQLAELPYVSRESGSGTREVVDEYFRRNGIQPEDLHITMELGSREAIKGAVEAGLGVAIVSLSTIQKELKLGDLIAIPLEPRLNRPLSLVYAKEKFQSRLLQTFLECVVSTLKAKQ